MPGLSALPVAVARGSHRLPPHRRDPVAISSLVLVQVVVVEEVAGCRVSADIDVAAVVTAATLLVTA
jgi:hypothetical protein